MRLRAAEPADAAALAELEIECEPRPVRVGAVSLQRWVCRGPPSHAVVAADSAGRIVGALLSVRFGQLNELRGSNVQRVTELQREYGEFLLVRNVWVAAAAHAELRAVESELLRYAMLVALQAEDVRQVIVPVRCRSEIAAMAEGANYVALRSEPDVSRHLDRGAKLLQTLLPSWWPADGAEPAGEPLAQPRLVRARRASHTARCSVRLRQSRRRCSHLRCRTFRARSTGAASPPASQPQRPNRHRRRRRRTSSWPSACRARPPRRRRASLPL
jgi:hypothetical protein